MTNALTTEMHLGLRAGDWVEVRSAEEILATLDGSGALDELPFMPEMLQYCGKAFPVYRSAHKSCDTIKDWRTIRRMENAVHLGDLRCDGSGHGGCQAACLLFWKEAWLKQIPAPDSASTSLRDMTGGTPSAAPAAGLVVLQRAARVTPPDTPEGEVRYRCQATQHIAATTPMRWWDPRHYAKDLSSRNVGLGKFLRTMALAGYNNLMRVIPGGRNHPFVRGRADGKTPSRVLNLQAGELVRVRSREEIMETIDAKRKNRGMTFDEEMVPFCGKTFRVLRRVDHIVDERTGRMMHFSNPCLILEGVVCGGCLSRYRLFCPRSIYSYWREIWLERVEAEAPASRRGSSSPAVALGDS